MFTSCNEQIISLSVLLHVSGTLLKETWQLLMAILFIFKNQEATFYTFLNADILPSFCVSYAIVCPYGININQLKPKRICNISKFWKIGAGNKNSLLYNDLCWRVASVCIRKLFLSIYNDRAKKTTNLLRFALWRMSTWLNKQHWDYSCKERLIRTCNKSLLHKSEK